MLIINFEGREAKGLSKGRYDETFAGEDGSLLQHINVIAKNQKLCRVSSINHYMLYIQLMIDVNISATALHNRAGN